MSTVGVYSRPEPSLRLCLQYLDLTDCQLVDDANLCVIVSNCPQLAYLYLRRCTKVTGIMTQCNTYILSVYNILIQLVKMNCITINKYIHIYVYVHRSPFTHNSTYGCTYDILQQSVFEIDKFALKPKKKNIPRAELMYLFSHAGKNHKLL